MSGEILQGIFATLVFITVALVALAIGALVLPRAEDGVQAV